MTEWVDFFVYAAFAVMFWFVCARWSSQLVLPMIGDRNADWLAGNRELAASLLGGRWLVGSSWFLSSCYAWGAVSLVVLFTAQLGVWPLSLSTAFGSQQWEVLKEAHTMLLIAGLVYYFGCVGVAAMRIRKDVPLATRRQASLARRSVNDFVPRWVWTTAFALVAVQLTAWAVVGALGLYSTPGFWLRFSGPAAFSAILIGVARAMVTQRPTHFSAPDGRRWGVRFACASLIYAQIRFALQLYKEVDTTFEVARAMHLTLVLALVVVMLAIALVSRNGRRMDAPFAPAARPTAI